MTTKVAIVILAVAAVVAGLYVWQFDLPDNVENNIGPIITPPPEDEPGDRGGGPVACTLEAKICPDGTAVGRTGPNCEFAPCPTYSGGIKGNVLLGPICPVVMDPPDPSCQDRPYETRLALTTPDGSRVIKEFYSDAGGNFVVSAAPGEYAIRSSAAANVLPYCSTNETVRVVSGEHTQTVVYCDTGIR